MTTSPWLPEAALVGAASGAFASAEIPTLAPLFSSEAFIATYERARGRAFTADEREVLRAIRATISVHRVVPVEQGQALAILDRLIGGGK